MIQTKDRTIFCCTACGAEFARWRGRCDQCGEWSTVEESPGRRAPAPAAGPGPVPLPEVCVGDCLRFTTGLSELDRVLGGGLVAGSVVLVAGDPGVGKSTLLLCAAAGLARSGRPVLYVTGEESPAQTRLRAERLGIEDARIHLLPETEVEAILAHAGSLRPVAVIVDSVQTLRRGASGAGSPSQVRDGAAELTVFAKRTGTAMLLVGHVTKTGDVAGPMTLAHLVDAVLSLEGDRYQSLRALRALKNRFGSAEEVGLFEMCGDGLCDAAEGLPPPPRDGAREPGSVLVPVAEGSRILLLEAQALTVAGCSEPRRRSTGLDPRRIEMLAAVLAQKAGLDLRGQDIWASLAGGLRVDEPGTDLAVALAVASSLRNRPVPPDLAAFGEVGLLGEVRSGARGRARLAEAARFGVTRVLVPPGTEAPEGVGARPVRNLAEALAAAGLRA
ncbi:MAG: DNA repair protein RadA [Planctomycetes bacterium]|nr:DNA repair protein RadA [Planctomycetota bacterium]